MENQKRLQNEIEQDRIAKTLEPVVAEYNLRKLPTTLVDEIRWWAREPTPTAKIMKNVRVSWRVFPHSVHSPFGPGKKCVITVKELGRRVWMHQTFAISDIPLDAEPTYDFQLH